MRGWLLTVLLLLGLAIVAGGGYAWILWYTHTPP